MREDANWMENEQEDEKDEHLKEQENVQDNNEILIFLAGNLTESEREGLKSQELCTDLAVKCAVRPLMAVSEETELHFWSN
jgi:hypothetical protein